MSEKRVVKVEFWDHAELIDQKMATIKEQKPILCVCIGELIAEGPDHITVLNCYQSEGEDVCEPQNHAMCIVKSTIIERIELTPKEGEKHV